MFKSKRTLVNIAIFGSFILIPFLPWYIPFVGAIIASWYFSYYEFLILGFLIDVFFASSYMSTVGENNTVVDFAIGSTIPFVKDAPSFAGTFFFTLVSAAIVLILQMIKKRVRFYS
jgi:hypothetical protein